MATDVKSIQFGVLSDDDIMAMAACKIDQPSLTIERGGVYDPRLGCTRNDITCATCDENVWTCSGHFGYIDLTTPIILFHKQVVALLKCVCFECCRLLASEQELRLNNVTGYDKTLTYLHTLTSCGHCKWPAADIKYLASDSTIVATLKFKQNKAQKILEPSFIKSIFDLLSDSDVDLLCLDKTIVHPRNYVLTKFPVLPTCCRPKMHAGENICDDDLTLLLIEILKANSYILNHEKAADPIAYAKAVDIIRTRTLAYCDNSRGKVTHNTNHKPMTGIKERINCKTGLMRQNLTGKRCDMTARTVIGPDPTLTLDQVAVPMEIANILTLPEYVTRYSIDKLTTLVNEGRAATIIKKSGIKINVHHARIIRGTKLLPSDVIIRKSNPTDASAGDYEFPVLDCRMILKPGDRIRKANGSVIDAKLPEKRKIKLQLGDIVERYLQDGDPIYLNRQPTLHRNSMLGMKAVVKPGRTLRFNLAITKELNADFDGDEGNMFCCASQTAAAEIEHLVSAKEHMLSAQSPKPEHCLVQDSLLAAYLMTAKPEVLSRSDFEYILFKTNKFETYTPPPLSSRPLLTKDLFSYIFPSDFCYSTNKLVIERGIIKSGFFDKQSLGSTSTAIVRLLRMEYDKHVAADFIDNMQFITNAWLEIHPFSIGFDDCLVGKVCALTEIRQTVEKFFVEAATVNKSVSNPDIREAKINMALNKAKDLGLKIAKEALSENNKIIDTVVSGSKGDFFNIAQITGLLGQQNLDNSRPIPSLTNKSRTLIHYPHVIINPNQEYESRGFVQSSFLGGLNPKEMWFHAMTGREGMISTALKTASSGYIQRSCVKLNEDLKVEYDGTVRDANGGIHQFAYGNTGFDPSLVSLDNMPLDFDRIVNKLNQRQKNQQRHKLTCDQINYIIKSCTFPRTIPDVIWQSIWTKHENKLRRALNNIAIAKDQYESFANYVIEKYISARACPGESVGIIGAQSIGEIQTQSNLNTFHTAGKLQTSGVDRFEEILKLTKSLKQPRMTIYFNKKFTSASELRQAIGSSIVGLELKNVTTNAIQLPIQIPIENTDTTSNIGNANAGIKYRIKFPLKKSILFSVLLSPDAIMEAIEMTYYAIECTCEPMAIVVNVMYSAAKSRSRVKKKDDTTTTSNEEISTTIKKHLSGSFVQIVEELRKCHLCGIPGIKEMHVDKTDTGEFYLITRGSNLRKMLCHPLVDITRLYTNDIWETYDCLGIAATKRMLLKDLKDCVSGVNDCHVRLLVEKMTFKGKPSSITRYTMRINDVGPLSKATFEQSVDVIHSAAFRGEIDRLNGISASIVVGNHVRVGTGMIDLVLDWEKIQHQQNNSLSLPPIDDVYY